VSLNFPCMAHAQNLMLFVCWIHCKIVSGQIHDSK
jgi:hypothetical protein